MHKTTTGRPYDLFPLLFLNGVGYIVNFFTKKHIPEFPTRIGNYYFIQSIEKIGPRKSYLLALYKTKNGKKAIAKMRDAHIKGYHYYSLLNEAYMYTTLHAVFNRIKGRRTKKFSKLYIPDCVGTHEDKHVLVILIEFVNGKQAETLPAKQKSSLYFLMIDFIHFLGENLTDKERSFISSRRPYHYIILYPLLVCKAIITYPYATAWLIRGVPVFLAAIPDMIKRSELKLVHRDLHFMNILLDSKRISLIDLQQCVLTEPLHEIITTLRYWWKEDNLYIFLMRELLKRYEKREKFEAIFRGYSVNSVTHGLTGSGFSKKITDGWVDFLAFAIHPNFTQYKK